MTESREMLRSRTTLAILAVVWLVVAFVVAIVTGLASGVAGWFFADAVFAAGLAPLALKFVKPASTRVKGLTLAAALAASVGAGLFTYERAPVGASRLRRTADGVGVHNAWLLDEDGTSGDLWCLGGCLDLRRAYLTTQTKDEAEVDYSRRLTERGWTRDAGAIASSGPHNVWTKGDRRIEFFAARNGIETSSGSGVLLPQPDTTRGRMPTIIYVTFLAR